ncbi:MAG: hypothetical protein ACRDPT_12075 [Streptomycetales bacterium]
MPHGARGRPVSWVAVCWIVASAVAAGLGLVLGPIWWLVAGGLISFVLGGLFALTINIFEDYS